MLNKQLTFFVGLKTKTGALLMPSYVIEGVGGLFTELGWDGFTVTHNYGYWKGIAENSLTFSVLFDSNELPGFSPECLAGSMAAMFNQEAVLYVIHGVFADLVEATE